MPPPMMGGQIRPMMMPPNMMNMNMPVNKEDGSQPFGMNPSMNFPN